MRISSPAVRTLLVSGVLGALALTTTGCQSDEPAKPKAPVASTPVSSPSATTSPSIGATPSPSATPPSPPPASKVPAKPKPKPTEPSLPPLMDDGGSGKGGGDSVYYKNCAAARAAGVAPLHRGDPGYDSHLDRDGDGIACER
ncbi:excalibur calcium-binding domain-containing protein [Streptomyces sp. NPDC059161]|uniref:excalibur calcium-binding domain-containing protein n=1 Tax=unclassified Streptomyces TaxID=2593676 RepID=UPI003648C7DD